MDHRPSVLMSMTPDGRLEPFMQAFMTSAHIAYKGGVSDRPHVRIPLGSSGSQYTAWIISARARIRWRHAAQGGGGYGRT